MSQVTLEIVTSREAIVRALFQSRMSKSLLGLKSKVLGPGTYFTTVKEILLKENDEVLIKIEGYDMTGYFLDKSDINLSDIEYVIPLTALFENPFTRDLERDLQCESPLINSKLGTVN
jgi:hypothetical protein